MKLSCLFLITSLCWVSPLRVQVHEILHRFQPTKPDIPSDLAVHAQVMDQTYCHVDVETFSVQMRIRLRFTNVSDHTVILSRRIESPSIVRVAKSVPDAAKGNFEYDPSPDYFPGKLPTAPRFRDRPDPKYFVTLAPKESYEVTVVSGVLGAVDASRAAKTKGLLPKGDHVLQLGVDTWPYQWPHFITSVDANELLQRWAADGHLVTNTVFSDFVCFTIPEDFKNPACKS